jgi:hypothetical protein
MNRRKTQRVATVLSTGALIGAALAGCGDVTLDDDGVVAAGGSRQAIINGTACDEAQEPTAVAIMLDASIDFGQGAPFEITQTSCTGTLIAPDVVLLAAHCLDLTTLTFGFGEVQRADFYVSFEADLSRFGAEQSLPLPESAIPTVARVAHDGFDLNSLGQGTAGIESDIALLFLAAPVEAVVPEVVLSRAEGERLSEGQAVTIAGWGQQVPTAGPFDPPPAGSVGIKVCGASTIEELGEALLQVGAGPETTRKCRGDSGGPTYAEVASSSSITRRVIGVTSRAYDQSDCNKGGVDTRVDYFASWIDDQMTSACADGTRTWCEVRGVLSADDVAALTGAAPRSDDPADVDEDGGDDAGGPVSGCGATPAALWASLGGLCAWRRRRRR